MLSEESDGDWSPEDENGEKRMKMDPKESLKNKLKNLRNKKKVDTIKKLCFHFYYSRSSRNDSK